MKVDLKIVAGVVLVLVVGLLWWFQDNYQGVVKEAVDQAGLSQARRIAGDGFDYDEDTPGYETYLGLAQGCPRRDCIPAIDEPEFESVADADEWLTGDDVVFVVEVAGEVKVYPQKIMNWHEIVNDEVGGAELAITFCPLCGSVVIFDREVGGQLLSFGVSGKLRNSDLVMYDRETESLWQQISGEAIVGELIGTELEQRTYLVMEWGEVAEEYANARVLSRETGFGRDYDRYPYGSYESDGRVIFEVEGGVDERLHPKEVVFGLSVDGVDKAYPVGALEAVTGGEGEINDVVGGERLRLVYDGRGLLVFDSSGERVVTERLFWFAWEAFHPETEIFGN